MPSESMDDTPTPSALKPFGVELSKAVFDRATRIAKSLFQGGDATIILIQDGRVWRSRDPLGVLPAGDEAAEIVMRRGELMCVADARKNARFAENPLVVGPPFIRLYVGAPIRLADG